MKLFLLRNLVFILICFAPLNSYAQESRNEIGAGLGLVTFSNEDGFAPAFHIHYLRSFSQDSPFAFTAGFEMILDEHQHNTLGIGISYNFWKEMSLGVSPGISFVPDESPEAGLHIELSYEFELGKIHLGPMFEYGLGADHSHTMFGIHSGYGF